MTEDPFNILGQEFEPPPTFEEAVQDHTQRFRASVQRFSDLLERVPEEKFTDEEWRLVERTYEEVEAAVERAEEGYVAVHYDTHAWYRILENLQTIHLRLESAIHLMETVLEREADTSRS